MCNCILDLCYYIIQVYYCIQHVYYTTFCMCVTTFYTCITTFSTCITTSYTCIITLHTCVTIFYTCVTLLQHNRYCDCREQCSCPIYQTSSELPWKSTLRFGVPTSSPLWRDEGRIKICEDVLREKREVLVAILCANGLWYTCVCEEHIFSIVTLYSLLHLTQCYSVRSITLYSVLHFMCS